MANSDVGTSIDVARASGEEYHVFLSFRGLDTRHGFTDFLYRDLVDIGIRVFRDDEELRVGEEIGENLLSAINSSIIYIPIFSQTYASSKWCLRELAHIVNNMSKSEGTKSILPIFFNVEPEVVKLKAPLYRNALLEHEKQFPNEVEEWREALKKVGKIKGWNVKSSQAEIVKSVVEEVLEKLEIKQKELPRHLVRLDAQIKYLITSLDINQRGVQLIAIWGMGGIGKTTVTKVIFNQLSSKFGKRCSFLEDVRESSLTEEGIVRLQKKLLSDIVSSRFAEQIQNSEQGMKRIGEALRTEKVLVVLDDVAEKRHIERLIGDYSLYSGSRIIITTRDKTILPNDGFHGEIQWYEMPEMDVSPALQLFCRHAFGTDSPPNDYRWLSDQIVSSMGGLPLAIEVIGALLKKRDKPVWEETLGNLENAPEKKIMEKLKISYDGLEKSQQHIFLDIACFFFNKNKTDPIYMWDDCKWSPQRGIKVLIERCLIKIVDNDKFWMHDQLIALGREIVRQDNLGELEKQSRLWIAKEALEIIRIEERKKKVEALGIDGLDEFIEITNQELKNLQNLRFLKLRNGTFSGDFTNCHSKLKWISWHCPRQDFRADNMYLGQLVVFKLGANGFTDDSKAWDLIKRARNLKVIAFTKCDGITTIPDFSECLRLKRLTLTRCSRLKRIKSFIGHLKEVTELDIQGCTRLTDLPEEVGALVKLNRFSLHGCCELSKLPSSLGNLTSLTELDLSGTGIAKSNPITTCDLRWIGRLSGLKKLGLNVPNMPVLRELASLSHLKELTVSEQYLNFLNLLPSLTYLQIKECPSLGGLIHPSKKTEDGVMATAWRSSEESRCEDWKLVVKLDIATNALKKKAMKIASGCAGVDWINIDTKNQKLTVGGPIDPVEFVKKLRTRIRRYIPSGVEEDRRLEDDLDKKKHDDESHKNEQSKDSKADPSKVYPFAYGYYQESGLSQFSFSGQS